jgi:hypothetical protein
MIPMGDMMQGWMVMVAVGSFGMLIHISFTTWHCFPEESCCHENLKSHTVISISGSIMKV